MGIKAVPVDVVVDRDRNRVVEPETGRVLHTVRLDRTSSERPILEHVVNVRTYPLRKCAPERLRAKRHPITPIISKISISVEM